MCLRYLAGALLQRWGPQLNFCPFHHWILNEPMLTMLTRLTMDPEAVQEPEAVQDPMETPTPAPETMMMERSSSEAGSNSSLSTNYFTKKSGSATSSRSGSGASTSRSPPDQEVAALLLSGASPSFGQSQGQEHAEDDQSSYKILVQSPEKDNDNTLVTKADTTGASEHPQDETKVIQELQKSSDTIVKEFRHTESIMIKEAEQVAESACSCCRPCAACCRSVGTWGFCGDVAAVLCCPFTVISLLSCICFKCPKMFATKTAEKVKTIKSRGQGEENRINREESEFLESTSTTAREIVKQKEGHCECHHDHEEKLEVIALTTASKAPESHAEKKDWPVGAHKNYFFPSPGVEDDRPGSDKSGGR